MLKMIALITMIIDHIGFFWSIDAFRIIGRVSFPIYCFLTVKGIENSRNLEKYMNRLLGLGIVSQIIWYFIGYKKLNILFTYFLFIKVVDLIRDKKWVGCTIFLIFTMMICPYIDYGIYGFALLLIFYISKEAYVSFIMMFIINMIFILCGRLPVVSIVSVVAIGLIKIFDKEKYYESFKNCKKLFYIAYPTHLAILLIVSNIIGNI